MVAVKHQNDLTKFQSIKIIRDRRQIQIQIWPIKSKISRNIVIIIFVKIL